MERESKSTLWRTRWAAIGAAVAVALGAGGGISFVDATIGSGERAVYSPITPCRLADLRTAPFTVGPRTAPLGPTETFTLTGRGAVGECNLSTGATGLSLNVTALNATADTFLTIFPASSARPNAANLNPSPGQPPIPNAVNVDLDGAGQFSVYNQFGNVNIVIDVVGVFEDHHHDDRYVKIGTFDAHHHDGRYLVEVITAGDADFVDFVPELTLESAMFTTTKAGRLHVTTTFNQQQSCSPSNNTTRYRYLVVDGVPVRSSLTASINATGRDIVTMVGTTSAALPAGEHTISIGIECAGANTAGGSGFNNQVIYDIIVLRD